MANNYFQPVNDHFGYNNYKLEDVDDDAFLNSSYTARRPAESTLYDGPSTRSAYNASYVPKPAPSSNPFDDEYNEVEEEQQRILKQRQREIEEKTLSSTQKSLNLLFESEEVGKATAIELTKQREQLEKTNRQLDDISASLHFSQRHLNGLKSVFGSLKNYFSGNQSYTAPAIATGSTAKSIPYAANPINESNISSYNRTHATGLQHYQQQPTRHMYDDHPISRIRGDSSIQQQRIQMQSKRNTHAFEVQLEANLEEMCDNLSRLKGLATDMSREIESQNDLLNNMNYKIENVDITLSKQNRDINKLLGKK